ncbi:MAG: hypothetical protein AMJ76_02200 [Dehalococcoidia bacterium SM23_28_1]|nr:MAG: hypothetical protein AMJ76_02200 [Dehalococcoidia bacterium SM23_28_1]
MSGSRVTISDPEAPPPLAGFFASLRMTRAVAVTLSAAKGLSHIRRPRRLPVAYGIPLILSLSKDEHGSWFDKLTMSGSYLRLPAL